MQDCKVFQKLTDWLAENTKCRYALATSQMVMKIIFSLVAFGLEEFCIKKIKTKANKCNKLPSKTKMREIPRRYQCNDVTGQMRKEFGYSPLQQRSN